eukprot:jgi/Undpi1/3707/HiC_scaffold_16.g07077.m1
MFPVSGYRHAARTVGTPQLTMFRRSSVALACRPRRRNRDTRTSPRQAPGKEKERALVTGPGCRHLWSTSREPSRPIAYMTSSPSMLSSLATIACVCFLAPYRSTTTVEGFIAPSPPSARLGGSLSSSSSASALGLLEGLSGGACLGVESLSNCYRSSATLPRHSSGDRRRNDPRGGGGDRRQPARMAASSRVNGADVSQDLSQLNGAEEATPVEVPAATQRTAQQRGFPATLSLGAPRHRPGTDGYTTKGNVDVSCEVMDVPHAEEYVGDLVDALNSRKGVLLTSSYEFPGRYARWTLGFSDPPLELSGTGRDFRVRALNDRQGVIFGERWGRVCVGEERSRQPSLFSVVRAAVDLFYYDGDPQLGLYGAFGYDLTFQFDSIPLKHERDGSQKDLLLYLPDKILVVDQDKRDAWSIEYEFSYGGVSTEGLPREGEVVAYTPSEKKGTRDTPAGDYAKKVDKAKEEFKIGNLFEVVLSQTFKEPCSSRYVLPAEVFRRLRKRNPSPYGFLINLGDQEYLVGASPEMFVRCERTGDGIRVETCPISGTIERGANPLEDAQRIRTLLTNKKEESELTMCTDVDRNDKSRICEPSSVRVLGRRQIEMYSRLIHTVDHVEGYLRKGFDALDAFLCHTWAVTVTGAPKTWAIRFVEQNEASPRAWYGGAVGLVGFDGHLNTGLTLRTVRVKDGTAEVRAGATLLFDSEPVLEEAETELKASAMIDAVTRSDPEPGATGSEEAFKASISTGVGKFVLLIDHEDSFVHTLGNYLRQTGAEVTTVRSGKPLEAYLRGVRKGSHPYPDLVVLSPGPGNPGDFGLSDTIKEMLEMKIPAFGVCLGLQGMVEHFGGELGVLSYPMHGKPSTISVVDRDSHSRGLFDGISDSFEVARYHSLHGPSDKMPDVLRPIARTAEGVVMAIEHKELPFAAVQFHPESILTNPRTGLMILANCFRNLRYPADDD